MLYILYLHWNKPSRRCPQCLCPCSNFRSVQNKEVIMTWKGWFFSPPFLSNPSVEKHENVASAYKVTNWRKESMGPNWILLHFTFRFSVGNMGNLHLFPCKWPTRVKTDTQKNSQATGLPHLTHWISRLGKEATSINCFNYQRLFCYTLTFFTLKITY